MISIALVAGLALARRHDLVEASAVLTASSPAPLLVAVALSLAAVVNRAGQFRWAHVTAGIDTDLRSMLRISAAGYALNKVVKAGGVGGVALFLRHGRRRGQPAGSVLAACLINALGGHLAMVAVTIVAMTALAIGRSLSGPLAVAGMAVVVGLVGTVAAIGAAGTRGRDLIERLAPIPLGLASRAANRLGLPAPSAPDPAQLDHFFETIVALRRDPASTLPVVAHAVAAKVIGAAVLGASLWAVGAELAPGTVLAVYVVALVAAATTVLPGGLGAVEATMTLALTSAGVPTSTALAATIVFRLLDLWVPVLIGSLAAPGLDRSTERATARAVARAVPPPIRHAAPIPRETFGSTVFGDVPR